MARVRTRSADGGIRSPRPSRREWVTGLWDLEECEEAYSEAIWGDKPVNMWRFYASLGRLDGEDQRRFVRWASRSDDIPEGFGGKFAKRCVEISGIMPYKPVMELFEELQPLGGRLDEHASRFWWKWTRAERSKLVQMQDIAADHGVVAHGTMNYNFGVGYRRNILGILTKRQLEREEKCRFVHPLQHHWAMLSIMFEDKLAHGVTGVMNKGFNPDAPADYGPNYVLMKREGEWSRGRNHMAFVVSNRDTVRFMHDGLGAGIPYRFVSEVRAADKYSRVMTYEELIEHEEKLDDVIEGKIHPSKLTGRKPGRI